MKARRLLVVGLLVVAAAGGIQRAGNVTAASDAPSSSHPYSDPIWSPLRTPARVSCVKTNCDGPYHGYDAIDFLGELGDPIYAAGSGVFHIGDIDPGCAVGEATAGTWVWVDHGPAGSTRYHHLDSVTAVDGQLVTPGTQIGTMGHSGDKAPCVVNYLHMELRDSETGYARQAITNFLACADGRTLQLPQEMGFSTWDDVVPQVHYTPEADNTCLPDKWSDTPSEPPAVAVRAEIASVVVGVPDRPAGIDDVRARVQLYHPSLDAYGTTIEQSSDPLTALVVFDDLLPNRRYRASVSFHNSAGWSAWSAPVVVQSGFLPTVPAYRDSDASAQTIGYKWYLGSNHGADYTVAIRPAVGTGWGSWTYTEVPAVNLHHRFLGLTPGATYQVTVRAHNDFGRSNFAPYRTVTTLCSAECPPQNEYPRLQAAVRLRYAG